DVLTYPASCGKSDRAPHESAVLDYSGTAFWGCGHGLLRSFAVSGRVVGPAEQVIVDSSGRGSRFAISSAHVQALHANARLQVLVLTIVIRPTRWMQSVYTSIRPEPARAARKSGTTAGRWPGLR